MGPTLGWVPIVAVLQKDREGTKEKQESSGTPGNRRDPEVGGKSVHRERASIAIMQWRRGGARRHPRALLSQA